VTRVCSNGHSVSEDYLKACPKCGSQLPRAQVEEANEPTEAAPGLALSDVVARAPRGLPMLVGGAILGIFGSLLSYAAEHGPAEVMGNLLLGLGAVLVLVGAVALGVKLGIEDARRD
jgi:hypothetical protein